MSTALEDILQSLDAEPDRVRIEYRDRSFTGADLRGRIAARAADLHRAGLKAGDTALIIVTENLCAIEQLIACWTLGAGGAFVDFRSPPARIDEWRQRLSPRLVLGLREVPGQPVHLQLRDPAPAVPGALPIQPDPGRRALVGSSSGTTGLPTLLDVTQGRLSQVLALLNDDPRAVREGTYLSAISVAFSASCYIWLRFLVNGRKIIALDLVHRIAELDHALQRPDVVDCGLPPGVIRQLAALPPAAVPRYPQLVRLASVGGPAHPEDKIAAVTRLSPQYVMSYSCAGVGLVSWITGPEILQRPASCGRPEPAVALEIRDGDRRCGPGEIGEILVTTDRLSRYRPGDLGWLDADGYLYITGRVQGMLSRNGVNFSAERLVRAALAIQDVKDAAVGALKNSDDGDEVHLVIQADLAVAEKLKSTLAAHLRSTLAAAEYPDRIHIWPDLPLTAGGKVDSRALSQMLSDLRHDAE